MPSSAVQCTVNIVINHKAFCETNKIGSMNKSEGSAWNNFCGILFLDPRNYSLIISLTFGTEIAFQKQRYLFGDNLYLTRFLLNNKDKHT